MTCWWLGSAAFWTSHLTILLRHPPSFRDCTNCQPWKAQTISETHCTGSLGCQMSDVRCQMSRLQSKVLLQELTVNQPETNPLLYATWRSITVLTRPFPILSRMNPLHLLTTCFFMTHIDTFLQNILRAPKWPFCLSLPRETAYTFLNSYTISLSSCPKLEVRLTDCVDCTNDHVAWKPNHL